MLPTPPPRGRVGAPSSGNPGSATEYHNETDTDTNKMACTELCGSVHTDEGRHHGGCPVSSAAISSVSVSVYVTVTCSVNTP